MGRKLSLSFALFLGLLLGLCLSARAQDAKSVLQSAGKTMGDVKSIQYSGTGELGALGQAFTPGGAWPINDIKSYTRTIDYGSKSAKEEMTLVEPTPIRKGGGGPFAAFAHGPLTRAATSRRTSCALSPICCARRPRA